MMETYWAEDAIQHAPVYALAECAALSTKCFDKEDLADIAALSEGITERFRAALFVCTEDQLAFLRCVAAMSTDKKSFEEMPQGGFYPFYFNGFVYLFSWEGQDFLVLPNELAELYNQVSSASDFTDKSKRNQALCHYANALLGLYGAYEIDWLVTVWNQHQREKITVKKAREVLSDLAYFHSDFYFEDDFVVHDCLFSDDFDALLEKVAGMDYYMPTKRVIASYDDSEHYERIPGANEMNTFLAGLITDAIALENLQFEIAMSCERLEPPAYVRAFLAHAGFPLDDVEAVATFERLYQNLRDNTRIWELRGLTPYQFENETGKRLKRFALPVAEKKKKSKKKTS